MQLTFETIREPVAGLIARGPVPACTPAKSATGKAPPLPTWNPPEDPLQHMDALCEALAPLLGMVYDHIDLDRRCTGYLVGPGEECIAIDTKWDKETHWHVRGVYPSCPFEYRGSYAYNVGPSTYDHERGEIKNCANISKKKRPEVIAAEIQARVLPGYLESLAKGLEGLEKHIVGVKAQRADLEAIAAIYGETYETTKSHGGEEKIYTAAGTWERYHGTDGTINLEARGLTLKQSLAIAAILAKGTAT